MKEQRPKFRPCHKPSMALQCSVVLIEEIISSSLSWLAIQNELASCQWYVNYLRMDAIKNIRTVKQLHTVQQLSHYRFLQTSPLIEVEMKHCLGYSALIYTSLFSTTCLILYFTSKEFSNNTPSLPQNSDSTPKLQSVSKITFTASLLKPYCFAFFAQCRSLVCSY